MRNSNGVKYTSAEQAILTTVLYSDIFSFPLNREELWRFLISPEKITRQSFISALRLLKKQIIYKDGYYSLKGREEIISQRKQNVNEITKKMKRARFVAQRLSNIPSIVFIGISGGLAVGNVTEKDDIDLVIITKKNTLFMTRVFVLGILEALHLRRFRNQQDTADTICVNLLFDETSLGWPNNKQDLYTAREIAQLIPLFERGKMYRGFIQANAWVASFLPNFEYKKTPIIQNHKGILNTFINIIFINSFSEYIFRALQIGLMKRHQTKETITNHLLAFHPNDYRTKTLAQLKLKVRQFGLLTKF